jgi:3-methyladenine DNA glycosylase AlkD
MQIGSSFFWNVHWPRNGVKLFGNLWGAKNMKTVEQVLSKLKAKGSEQTRKTFARHGIDIPMFGVKVGDLKPIAKAIRGDQKLALALYDTGNYDAMYLAGMVADGSQMSKKEIEGWAKQATCNALCSYPVVWVAAESTFARELAIKWIGSKNPSIAVSGWGTYAGILATQADEDLDLKEIKKLLSDVVAGIHKAPDRVRYMMNAFVIAVGGYVAPLLKQAKEAAKKIGTVSVDMGDTDCKVPSSLVYIERIEAMGRVGKKRKTMKC